MFWQLLLEDEIHDENTLGVMLVEKKYYHDTITNRFDSIFLIFHTDIMENAPIEYVNLKGKRVKIYRIGSEDVSSVVHSENNQFMSRWIMEGEILFERNKYIHFIKERLHTAASDERLKNIGVEFAKYVRCFEEAKLMLHIENSKGAYYKLVKVLEHQAKISILEHQLYPEFDIWSQVRFVDYETYKLYEQLINGEESVEKRVELLFIAIEFVIVRKLSIGSEHIRNVIEEFKGKWTIKELLTHCELRLYNGELDFFLDYLNQKGKINII